MCWPALRSWHLGHPRASISPQILKVLQVNRHPTAMVALAGLRVCEEKFKRVNMPFAHSAAAPGPVKELGEGLLLASFPDSAAEPHQAKEGVMIK